MPAAVNAKPFSWQDRLYKTVFLGKPNIFSAQDLNRYLDAIHGFSQKVNEITGAIRDNFDITVDVQPVFTTIGASESTFEFTYSITKNLLPDPAVVYYKGVRFNVPTAASVVKEITIPVAAGSYNVAYAYFVLVATKKTVTFNSTPPVLHVADPKAFSGVTSADFPYELPAADNVIYGDERIEVVSDLSDISLGADEEIICILGTLRPRIWWKDAATVESVASDQILTIITHNAAKLDDLATLFKFFIPGTAAPKKPVYTKAYIGNGGLVDALNLLVEQYIQGQSYQDYRLAGVETSLSGYITSNDAALAAANVLIAALQSEMDVAQADIAALENAVTALQLALPNKADKAQEAWRYVGDAGQPAFSANWVSALGGNGRCRFYKDQFGIVRISGHAKKVTGVSFGDVIWDMPDGYRPTSYVQFPVLMWTGTGFPSFSAVGVSTNGDVTFLGSSSEAADTGFQLDSITYRAEQ